MARHDHKGRRKAGPPFARLFHYVMDSGAYRALSVGARAALLEVCRVYDGGNNGRIAMPVRSLGERLNVSMATASRYLIELDDAGFIACQRFGSFTVKDRLASEWRLTFYRCDLSGTPPTRDFLKAHSFKNTKDSFIGETVDA